MPRRDKTEKDSQLSLDFLIRILPMLIDKSELKKNIVDNKAANNLFGIWKDEKLKLTSHLYKKPSNVAVSDIKRMSEEGLIKLHDGDKLEITKKGHEIIRTMILGDESSSFDEKESIDYLEALTKVKEKSIKHAKKSKGEMSNSLKQKITKEPEDNFWKQFS
jgi:hypothetical protein